VSSNGASAVQAEVDAIVAETGGERRHLLAILGRIQERYRFLPEEALARVAETTCITPAEIEGVSTFYSRFRRTPAGVHTVRVCVGTACFVKGGENIYDSFRLALRIRDGEDTDPDGLFTVEKAACLGCCMLAPVVQIDSDFYGHLTRQKVPSVLQDFLSSRTLFQEEGAAAARSGSPEGPAGRGVVSLCTCTSCRASGAGAVYDAFGRAADALRLPVDVKRSGCTGVSYRVPVVEVTTASGATTRYAGVSPGDVPLILHRHFQAPAADRLRHAVSLLVDRLMQQGRREPVSRLSLDLAHGPDGAFWGPQVRVVTAQWGMDPLDLDGYLAAGGFEGLRRCLSGMSPRQVIELVESSGLRGRGGGGYPTASKWREVSARDGRPKHLLCNADEGDPGAFMDRLTLESFPFRVLEGMAIAAYAVGADTALVFIREEYPLAIRRVRAALEACGQRGILGGRVLGFPFSFSVDVAASAGAFVCGEETAMIAAVEGLRGNPRAKPPYPAERGLWGRPTLVNNVETFATVPWILQHGAQAFRELGTRGSPGTKTFALAGKVLRGGLIEVPMGMSIRRIVEEIGGGIQGERKLKAVQIGGPSGGCIPGSLADLPVDYESLTGAGAMMGSGGMVVLDDTDCMVDVARYFMAFTQKESCGKCAPCRVGTRRMLEVLERLCAGTCATGDVGLLEELALAVKEGSLCGLGRTAPNPVLTTLRYFRAEYEEHLAGRCPAGRCKALIGYLITEECIGCTRCAQRCPSRAIEAQPYQVHRIDQSLCVRCGTCRQACLSNAVRVVPRTEALAAQAQQVPQEPSNA
jgi:NADH-quinone oxidoreductase subunit F